IVTADTPYHRTIAAGRAAVEILNDGIREGKLRLSKKEQQWLARIDQSLDSFPSDENCLIESMDEQYGNFYDKSSYGFSAVAEV
ncbi:MAG: methyltransferase MtaB domain-containing protein, partial [Acidobacteriota bacterium]